MRTMRVEVPFFWFNLFTLRHGILFLNEKGDCFFGIDLHGGGFHSFQLFMMMMIPGSGRFQVIKRVGNLIWVCEFDFGLC